MLACPRALVFVCLFVLAKKDTTAFTNIFATWTLKHTCVGFCFSTENKIVNRFWISAIAPHVPSVGKQKDCVRHRADIYEAMGLSDEDIARLQLLWGRRSYYGPPDGRTNAEVRGQ